jgi:hypothetical protein
VCIAFIRLWMKSTRAVRNAWPLFDFEMRG